LDALLADTELELPADEALVRRVAVNLLRSRDLDDDLFAEAQRTLGTTALTEVITLVGYYDLLALSMRVWRTPLPPDVAPVF
jgi:4-carboxymuconolactone decarboxylase